MQFRFGSGGRWYSIRIFSSGYLDYGVEVCDLRAFREVYYSPHFLCCDVYGTHGSGRPWGRRTWSKHAREVLEGILDMVEV